MLNILLESALIELLEGNKDVNQFIDYTYDNLEKSFLTDIEKEIKQNNISKESFTKTLWSIYNDEDFRLELKDMGIEIN
jgi:6-pyruvoyl-tetrahydropterin synthase